MNCCSIYVFNVLISSSIMFLIFSSMFIVPRGMGPSSGGRSSSDEHRVEDAFLWELDSDFCFYRLFTTEVPSGVDNGCFRLSGYEHWPAFLKVNRV